MIIEKIFNEYWTQISVLLFGIGYLIKKFIDNKSKKMEINHSLFQERKLEAINTFFINYSKLERHWIELPIYDVLRHEIKPKQLDEIQFPLISALKESILGLQIFFNKNDYSEFKKILDNVFEIKSTLSHVYLHYSKDDKVTERCNEYIFKRDKISSDNKKIIEEITEKIRAYYE